MRGSVEQELDPDLKSVETRNLQERMRRKIVGQDEAVQAVDSTRRRDVSHQMGIPGAGGFQRKRRLENPKRRRFAALGGPGLGDAGTRGNSGVPEGARAHRAAVRLHPYC